MAGSRYHNIDKIPGKNYYTGYGGGKVWRITKVGNIYNAYPLNTRGQTEPHIRVSAPTLSEISEKILAPITAIIERARKENPIKMVKVTPQQAAYLWEHNEVVSVDRGNYKSAYNATDVINYQEGFIPQSIYNKYIKRESFPRPKEPTRKQNPDDFGGFGAYPGVRGDKGYVPKDGIYKTYAGWKRAVKAIDPKAQFYGDKDIGGAFGIGEWDGVEGVIYPEESRIKLLKHDPAAYGFMPKTRKVNPIDDCGAYTFLVQARHEMKRAEFRTIGRFFAADHAKEFARVLAKKYPHLAVRVINDGT